MKKLFATLLMAVLFTPQLLADEGMWLLQLMRQQNLEDQMRKQGLTMSVDGIYSPDAPSLKDAIGIFGAGCTGEVISPNGLVITNHHCGFSYIQQLSTTTCTTASGARATRKSSHARTSVSHSL